MHSSSTKRKDGKGDVGGGGGVACVPNAPMLDLPLDMFLV